MNTIEIPTTFPADYNPADNTKYSSIHATEVVKSKADGTFTAYFRFIRIHQTAVVGKSRLVKVGVFATQKEAYAAAGVAAGEYNELLCRTVFPSWAEIDLNNIAKPQGNKKAVK